MRHLSVVRRYLTPLARTTHRDNLKKFWRNESVHSHALTLVTSSFEDVERYGKNVVLHFNQRPAQNDVYRLSLQ